MANILKDSESNIIVGRGSWTHTTSSAGMYFVSAVTIENPSSSIIITIAQSGSASVTVSSPTPSATQQSISLQKVFNCQSGDVLTVSFASSSPIDNQLNTVKSTVTVHRGQS